MHWVIAKHPAIEPNTFGFRRSRLTKQRPVRSTMRTVKPSIRSPGEPVGEVMRIRMIAKAVQQHFSFTVGPVVAIAIWNEEKIRRRHDPRAAESNLDPGNVIQLVVKDFAFVKSAISINIIKDQNSIPRTFSRLGIVIRFGNPQPSTIIDAVSVSEEP